MKELAIEKKQAAKWTVGRGSRALCQLVNHNNNIIAAATALANKKNQLHLLDLDKTERAFQSVAVIDIQSEIWSHEFLSSRNDGYQMLAAVRNKDQSFIESLSIPIQKTHLENQTELSSQLEIIESVPISGSILEVRTCPFDSIGSSQALYVTETSSGIIDTASTLRLKTEHFQSMEKSTPDNTKRFIGGNWVSENLVFVAASNFVELFDIRTNSSAVYLDMQEIIRKKPVSSNKMWLPPYVPRLKSACSDGQNNLICGGEDGSLRAIDIRSVESIWHSEEGHNHWVSVLAAFSSKGFLSGAVDGVVQCWSENRKKIATFPQHDDCVTNAICGADGFTTVSYNGRIAWNEAPSVT